MKCIQLDPSWQLVEALDKYSALPCGALQLVLFIPLQSINQRKPASDVHVQAALTPQVQIPNQGKSPCMVHRVRVTPSIAHRCVA
jgi:hypothetical protein